MNINDRLPQLSPAEMLELYMLRDYSRLCQTVTEFGVHDCTSTWWILAGLAGRPTKLTSYDIGCTSHPSPGNVGAVDSELAKVADAACQLEVTFAFILGDTRTITIEETDMLFIDSCHTYEHVSLELQRHAGQVRRYLAFHDTTVFAHMDESYNPASRGIWPAIEEFMAANSRWRLKDRLTNFNGLTILQKD